MFSYEFNLLVTSMRSKLNKNSPVYHRYHRHDRAKTEWPTFKEVIFFDARPVPNPSPIQLPSAVLQCTHAASLPLKLQEVVSSDDSLADSVL